MKCASKAFIFSLTVLLSCFTLLFFTGQYKFPQDESYINVNVDPRETIFETDQGFLSVAIDMSFLRCKFHSLNASTWKKLEEMTRYLSPGFLRLGGTAADQVIFKPSSNSKTLGQNYKNCQIEILSNDFFYITEKDWIKINTFVKRTNLNFIFDLNVLLRNSNGWNSSNAQELLKVSEEHKFQIDFQLGNEPNSFEHVFNISIPGSELAKDFDSLKLLLNSSQIYKYSKLIGPEVTKPRKFGTQSLVYLKEFLSHTKSIDVASWHQYYLSAKTALITDFINPDTFDVFPLQVNAVKETVREFSADLPIWISETSSASGGGAPGLSDRFVATFLWLDKLGISAKSGMSVVIRQSLFQGNYALIDDELTPNPDFWVSVLFKKLVGTKVLNVTYDREGGTKLNHLRFYSHCSIWNNTNSIQDKNNETMVVIYGLNFSNRTESLIVSGIGITYPVESFILTAENDNITVKSVLLNGMKLSYKKELVDNLLKHSEKTKFPLVLPQYSIAFWVLRSARSNVCG